MDAEDNPSRWTEGTTHDENASGRIGIVSAGARPILNAVRGGDARPDYRCLSVVSPQNRRIERGQGQDGAAKVMLAGTCNNIWCYNQEDGAVTSAGDVGLCEFMSTQGRGVRRGRQSIHPRPVTGASRKNSKKAIGRIARRFALRQQIENAPVFE